MRGTKKASARPVRCAMNAAMPVPITPPRALTIDLRRTRRSTISTSEMPIAT